MTSTMVLVVGLLTGVGVYLILARRVFPVILGLSLLTHAANLIVVSSGNRRARAPILVDGVDSSLLADPLPQALVLTAIVISMAVTLYLLATFVAGGQRLGMRTVMRAAESDSEIEADPGAEESDQVMGDGR